MKLETVPPLPKETTHFYARYNKITKINKSDFANMSMCRCRTSTVAEIQGFTVSHMANKNSPVIRVVI